MPVHMDVISFLDINVKSILKLKSFEMNLIWAIGVRVREDSKEGDNLETQFWSERI